MKFRLGALLLMAGMLIGCRTVQVKPEKRVASDQFLNAAAIEDATRQLTFGKDISGKIVKLAIEGLVNDKEFLTEAVEVWAVRQGAMIADEKTTPQLTLNIVAQAAGSDTEESGWRLPLGLPSLEAGLTLTYIDIYNNTTQTSRCHLWGYGVDSDGTLLFTQQPVYAIHYLSNRSFLGLSLGRSTDLVELKKTPGRFPFSFRKPPARTIP